MKSSKNFKFSSKKTQSVFKTTKKNKHSSHLIKFKWFFFTIYPTKGQSKILQPILRRLKYRNVTNSTQKNLPINIKVSSKENQGHPKSFVSFNHTKRTEREERAKLPQHSRVTTDKITVKHSQPHLTKE